MYEILKNKFELGFVRADQLLRYVAIGYLTEAQYHLIVFDEVLMDEESLVADAVAEDMNLAETESIMDAVV